MVASSYLAAARQNARDGTLSFERSLLCSPCANVAMVAMATIPMTHAAIFTTRLCNAVRRDAESRRIPMPTPSPRFRPLGPYFAAFLALGVALSFFGPALPTLRDQTGATLGQLGLVFAAQSVGGLVGSIVAGRLYRRLDDRGHPWLDQFVWPGESGRAGRPALNRPGQEGRRGESGN